MEKSGRMIIQFRNPHFYIMVIVDLLIFTGALFLAYAARYGVEQPVPVLSRFLFILPWVLGVKTIVFLILGAYRGIWRYTSLQDVSSLFKANFISSLLLIAGISFISRYNGYSRLIFIIDFIFTCSFTISLRTLIRLRRQAGKSRFFERWTRRTLIGDLPRLSRLLIIGAGDAAGMIIREIQENHRLLYTVTCCVDDARVKHGRSLLNVPIHGPIDQLTQYIDEFEADEVLIVIPSASGEQMRRIVGICEDSGARYRTLPPLAELIEGGVSVNVLREVDFEDLLGRQPIRLNLDEIGRYLTGKTVAVTGAGGSIGSEICRQIIRFQPSKLVLIDASEYNLYRIEMELRTEKMFDVVFPVMGRVQDRLLMEHVFKRFRPQVVLHAAACKHVPMVELNPWEAVFTNVVGSAVMMDLAEEFKAERFVLISTDKAVRPTNVMGISKRTAEIILQSRHPSTTRFMAVRFGNVVGSSGSVIPLFQRQIRAGGPVTVTHPEMTRYFMTIPEACQLVLQAGAMGDGGEIYLLEMGTPVKIDDMARDLIRLSGKKPDEDIKIIYTGLRPGEKMYEELITLGEDIIPTEHEKIMVLRRSGEPGELNARHEQMQQSLLQLQQAAESMDADSIKRTFLNIAPEYIPSDVDGVL